MHRGFFVLINMLLYADDVDFISSSALFLDEVKRRVPDYILKWHLVSHESKTEHTEEGTVMLRNGEKHAD